MIACSRNYSSELTEAGVRVDIKKERKKNSNENLQQNYKRYIETIEKIQVTESKVTV